MDITYASNLVALWRKSSQAIAANNVLDACVQYAHTRADRALSEGPRRMRLEKKQSKHQNSLIDYMRILEEQQRRAGEDTQWYSEMRRDKQVVGDLACLVHAALGISIR